MRCSAFLGASIDGFIAASDGDLSWLDATPNPSGSDLGYGAFMATVDAIVMGRTTFETVLGFDGPWPYELPLIVMSRSLTEVPEKAPNTEIFGGSPAELVAQLTARGLSKVYVDGGAVVTSFLNAGLLDEITITSIPVALGSGTPLFGLLSEQAWFNHVSTEVFNEALVQTTYTISNKP